MSQFDVFISYQWDVKVQVKEIFEVLKQNGMRVWMDDNNLKNDQNLHPALALAIKNSKIILCCITKKYDESTNCFREISWADSCKKQILVLMMERVDITELKNVGIIINPILRINLH